MHTGKRLSSLAVLTIPTIFIFVALWRAPTPQSVAIDQVECNSRDPLSSCAIERDSGTPLGDGLVFEQPELQSAAVPDQSLAVVRFASKASSADIQEFLDANQVSVVDGPKNGGLYTLRLRVIGEAKKDVINHLQAQSAIVEFIATVQ
jgi:hypothetical protein